MKEIPRRNGIGNPANRGRHLTGGWPKPSSELAGMSEEVPLESTDRFPPIRDILLSLKSDTRPRSIPEIQPHTQPTIDTDTLEVLADFTQKPAREIAERRGKSTKQIEGTIRKGREKLHELGIPVQQKKSREDIEIRRKQVRDGLQSKTPGELAQELDVDPKVIYTDIAGLEKKGIDVSAKKDGRKPEDDDWLSQSVKVLSDPSYGLTWPQIAEALDVPLHRVNKKVASLRSSGDIAPRSSGKVPRSDISRKEPTEIVQTLLSIKAGDKTFEELASIRAAVQSEEKPAFATDAGRDAIKIPLYSEEDNLLHEDVQTLRDEGVQDVQMIADILNISRPQVRRALREIGE